MVREQRAGAGQKADGRVRLERDVAKPAFEKGNIEGPSDEGGATDRAADGRSHPHTHVSRGKSHGDQYDQVGLEG
jgi:hypothetical protein